jgi:hypothetical protein
MIPKTLKDNPRHIICKFCGMGFDCLTTSTRPFCPHCKKQQPKASTRFACPYCQRLCNPKFVKGTRMRVDVCPKCKRVYNKGLEIFTPPGIKRCSLTEI